MDLTILEPRVEYLLAAVVLDLIFGDPVYPLHPIRLMGLTLTGFEKLLRAIKFDGYVGGCVLFLALAALWVGAFSWGAVALYGLHPLAGQAFHVFTLYSMVALGDLFKHGREVDHAASAGDLDAARRGVAMLVGRDTEKMDEPACRRAAMESLAESLVDGFASPLLWYVFGLPVVVLFKVVSTMDSMVGYKTERYLHFGWCGARLDDLLNYVPARLAWLFLAVAPGAARSKALRIGREQHALIPGPNAGWPEATFAGAIERRLIGPIWRNDQMVTELWIGQADDPEGGSADDYRRATRVVSGAAVLFVAVALILTIVRAALTE